MACERYYGIIPARYASTRFEGKPLAPVLGRPMFWHVYQRARQCPLFSTVVLATDDTRIASVAQDYDIPVYMTRTDHASGTDRVLEAAQQMNIEADAVVVNIQGDEPALVPAMLDQLLAPFAAHPAVEVTTLATPITAQEAANPDRVKVVCAHDRTALYFSRSLIPFVRSCDPKQDMKYLGHIGLYAFRMQTLQRFVALGQGVLEQSEQLEQLRLLENGIDLHVVLTEHISYGVDRREDIKKAEGLLLEERR